MLLVLVLRLRLQPIHAFLAVKLRRLNECNQRRVEIANYYSKRLGDSEVRIPYVPDWADPVWHLYVISTERRDELQRFLRENGVETMIHYPVPPHKQQCYAPYSNRCFPIAERLSRQVLSLPISSSMKLSDADVVVETIKHYFN